MPLLALASFLAFISASGCNKEPPKDEPAPSPAPEAKPKAKSHTVHFQQGYEKYRGTRDSTIEELEPELNQGGSSKCKIDGDVKDGKDRACLMRWSVSSIPKGSEVTSVEMRFRVLNGSSEKYSIYEMKKPWEEPHATWNSATKTDKWEKAGALGKGDRGKSVGSIQGSIGTRYASLNDEDAVAMVQRWVDGKNFGIVIADTKNSDGLDLASRQNSIDSDRPKLTVRYRH